MKTGVFLICGCLALAAPLASLAGDQTHPKPEPRTSAAKPSTAAKKGKQSPKRAYKESGVEMTGSHIRQQVRRSGRITDGPAQVVVIDHDAIERSGGADLRQVLSLGGVR